MKDFRKELYRRFEGNPHFRAHVSHIDRTGNYASFGAFGDLLHDILLGKIDDHELIIRQCALIDEICAVHDPEWNNVLRCEVFSIMNTKELLKLQTFLSEDSNKQLEVYLPKESMTEEELTSKLEKLGYTHLWMEFNVLTIDQLLGQEKLFDQGEDKNTEHYRLGVCVAYLWIKKILSDKELANYVELLKNDPNTYMSGSAAIEVFNRIDLTDKQFDWFSQEISCFGDWTEKLVLRHRFLRQLNAVEPTDELISDCILNGDSFVQDYLLDKIKLNQNQLQELSIHGKNKEIRAIAQKRLNF